MKAVHSARPDVISLVTVSKGSIDTGEDLQTRYGAKGNQIWEGAVQRIKVAALCQDDEVVELGRDGGNHRGAATKVTGKNRNNAVWQERTLAQN